MSVYVGTPTESNRQKLKLEPVGPMTDKETVSNTECQFNGATMAVANEYSKSNELETVVFPSLPKSL